MNYDEIADVVGHEIIEYKAKDESFEQVFNICLKRHGEFTSRENNKILTKVIHVITVMGYDIESTHPCRFKKFMN